MEKKKAVLIASLLIISSVLVRAESNKENNSDSAAVSSESGSVGPAEAAAVSGASGIPVEKAAAEPSSATAGAASKDEGASGGQPERIVSINSVYAMYTNQAKADPVFGYGTTSNDLLTFQFEHFSFHPWGDLYADAETYQGRNVGTPYSAGNNFQSLLVLDPRLSLSKITKKKVAFGPVSDVSLEARFERESYPDPNHFWTRNFGVAFNWKVPGFAYFASGVLDRYTNIDAKNTWFWRSVILSKPANVFGQRGYFNLLSFINGSGQHKTEVWERGDFLWEVARNRPYQAGIRLEYEHYSNNPLDSGRNYNRYLPELMLRYTF